MTAIDGSAGRVIGGLGNALFFGVLGTGAFFGYYTYRYTNDQIETMIEETKKPDNSFPGSSVSSTFSSNATACLSLCQNRVKLLSYLRMDTSCLSLLQTASLR